MERSSVLTCPECGHSELIEMPTNACAFFHECNGCHEQLRPKPGDCCVFCSYGSVPCPPIQSANGDCCTSAVVDEHRPNLRQKSTLNPHTM
jgi:hypothetical protein